jgi:potassium efflux system protein
LVPLPFTGAVIVALVLSPLCQPDAPFQYMEVVHLLLLISLCIFFWKRLEKSELRYWLFMVLLFVVIELTAAAVHDSLFLRLWFIFLNLSSLYFGVVFSRKLLRAEVAQSLIRPVLVIYLVLNGLAVLMNIFGRMSLAKAFTGTAIIGITEVIGLAVFIQLLTDALELQIKLSACNGGLFSRLDIPSVRLSFKKLLSGVAIVIWLLVFMINLGIAKEVWNFISKLLDNRRTFGSISFTIGNVLFFALILYLSNLFQKNVGALFGEKRVTFNNEVEHGSSKLTLFRLVIAIIGVLLAVTASGIPLDKLTVVLGALSVGIGLGMQNIVNNFVSGIILIFEKPFQIGDFVELADKKGKIQDIGIRASKMLTQQGSEVIIPNGDLISNRFTNWTINTANVKSEILLKVAITADLAAVTKIIKEEIEQAEDAVKNAVPDILINSIGADTIELRILIWISSIYAEPVFKSSLFSKLIVRFNAAQIKLM